MKVVEEVQKVATDEARYEIQNPQVEKLEDIVESHIICEGQEPGVVQKMVHKFSSHGSRQTPFLIRRNTVARCTNVMQDVRGRKHNLQHIQDGQHLTWVDGVTGADAATDLEFSSLMERISTLSSALTENIHMKKEDTVNLHRNYFSRKSLPAFALKSYMRGTKATVLKARNGHPPHPQEVDKCTINTHLPGGRSDKVSSSGASPATPGKNCSSHVGGGKTLQRRGAVIIKPRIPPILLKRAVSEDYEHEHSTSQTVSSVGETAFGTSYTTKCNNGDGTELSTQQHLLSGQCEGKCSHCLLVDLWFTIWHVEFNKK